MSSSQAHSWVPADILRERQLKANPLLAFQLDFDRDNLHPAVAAHLTSFTDIIPIRPSISFRDSIKTCLRGRFHSDVQYVTRCPADERRTYVERMQRLIMYFGNDVKDELDKYRQDVLTFSGEELPKTEKFLAYHENAEAVQRELDRVVERKAGELKKQYGDLKKRLVQLFDMIIYAEQFGAFLDKLDNCYISAADILYCGRPPKSIVTLTDIRIIGAQKIFGEIPPSGSNITVSDCVEVVKREGGRGYTHSLFDHQFYLRCERDAYPVAKDAIDSKAFDILLPCESLAEAVKVAKGRIARNEQKRRGGAMSNEEKLDVAVERKLRSLGFVLFTDAEITVCSPFFVMDRKALLIMALAIARRPRADRPTNGTLFYELFLMFTRCEDGAQDYTQIRDYSFVRHR